MKDNFNSAVEKVFTWEGGYSNHPQDPGGPTNYGITIADVKAYINPNATDNDVKNITKAQAKEIYRTKYWKTSYYDCDKLASGVDLAVFDFGVNSGPSRAKKYLDLSVGGPDEETVNKIFDYREKFLRGLSTFPTFGNGWLNRIKDMRATSLAWVGKKPIISGKNAAPVGVFALIAGTIAAWWQGLPEVYVEYAALGAVALTILGIFVYAKSRKD